MSREFRERAYRTDEVQALVATLPSTLPCLNPRCRRMVSYRERGSGRQPAFCSNDCRAAFHNERLRLNRALEALTRTVEPRAGDPLRAVTISRLRWVLDRYRAPGPDRR